MNYKTTLMTLGALALAMPLASQAMQLSSGAIVITMESWEQFKPGYGAAAAIGTVLPGSGTVGFYNDGVEDLNGVVNVLGTSQVGASNTYENIGATLAKSLGGLSVTGVLYGLDASYNVGSPFAGGSKSGYTGGFLDLYEDSSADESVVSGPGGGGALYPTVSDSTLLLRLAFTVGDDTAGFFGGANTGATLYGSTIAKPTIAGAGTFFFKGESSGFMDVVEGVGTLWEKFNTNLIPIGATSTTAAKFADFSFSNNFGTECMVLGTFAHIDGCGDPGFAAVGFDGPGAPDGIGLWNTQDSGPAHGNTVPEPSILALVGLSMLGLGMARRKGRKQA